MKVTGIVLALYVVVSVIWTILIYFNYELIYTGYGLYPVLGPISCLQGLFYGHSGVAFSLIAWSIPMVLFPILMMKAKSPIWIAWKAIGFVSLGVYWIGITVVDALNNV